MSEASAPGDVVFESWRVYLDPSPEPISPTKRIVSIDILRGFALLGILPMNIQSFSMIGAAYSNPTAYGNLQGGNLMVWLLSHVLADAKFITIFSMLFGSGILLMTSRIEDGGGAPAPPHYRRMGWLILFGLLHAYALWSGDILYAYGICGFFAYFFRKLPARTLLLTGLCLLAIASISLLGYGLWSKHWPREQVASMREQMWMPTSASANEELAAYRGSWIRHLPYRAADSLQRETIDFVVFTFWRCVGLMLIGMALCKQRILTGERPATVYWALMAAGVFIGIPVTSYGTWRDFAAHWDFQYSFFAGAQFNFWASLPVSLGWVGVIMLAAKAPLLVPLTRRLAAVGRMAFSEYILQTLVCATIFYGFGFGLFGKIERVWQFTIVAAIWLLQLFLSPIWLRSFYFGPLEWVWRSLTYWKREPFRRW
jgi:uncharacterized protein